MPLPFLTGISSREHVRQVGKPLLGSVDGERQDLLVPQKILHGAVGERNGRGIPPHESEHRFVAVLVSADVLGLDSQFPIRQDDVGLTRKAHDRKRERFGLLQILQAFVRGVGSDT